MSDDFLAVLLNGTVGTGKTTVAKTLAASVRADGIPGAAIDLDWLGEFWPQPPGDPFNVEITLANLRDFATNVRAAGARVLIMAGVIESADERRRFTEAVGGALRVIRLKVGLDLVRQRLERRHEDDPEGLEWHLNRSGELDAILDRAAIDDLVLDVTDLAPEDSVARIRDLLALQPVH